MAVYNLKPIKSPRLCGLLLDLASRLLRIPVIGHLIVKFIQSKNKIGEMVTFATVSHPGIGDGFNEELLPLYYPIHEMTPDEHDMHERMAKEIPLDLQELATMQLRTNDEQFRHWTILDYTSRYSNGTTTPSQVVETIIRAVEDMTRENNNKSVVSHMNIEEIRLQAAESTKRYQSGNIMGVLDGVPILVKDEIPTVGFETTTGTSFLADMIYKDLLPILKLKQQGAIVVGKTNQHEIGIGTTGFNLVYGTPKNPYGSDPKIHYYTGGSSSGSAAAVSMGLVPLAIGADGGGSVRIPASLCGCVGLKPTFKRIAIDWSAGCSLCHAGPMTNNIHDAALAYAIMSGAAGDDHRHQSQHQPPVHLHSYISNFSDNQLAWDSLKGVRIGVFNEHIEDSKPTVYAATLRAIEYYRSHGAEIVPITIPHLGEIHLAHGVTITTEMFSIMDRHYHSSNFNRMCPETRVSLAIGKSWSSTEFLAAQKVRTYAMKHIEDLFHKKVDIIVSPATPCCAPVLKKDALSHGESNLAETGTLMRYVIHGNFTGIPAIVFPIDYDDETSLPISLQLQAAHWREDMLFHVASKSQGILKSGIAKPSIYVDVLGNSNDD